MATTPMMEQYNGIKAQYADAVLFFRLGDFYEMFNSDAIEISQLLDLTLTKRGKTPMCGVPYHAAKIYIARLLKYGKKVAICEQITDPVPGQLVERKVVEVITPGTAVEDSLLESDRNSYLLAVYCSSKKVAGSRNDKWCGLAYIDVSTGDFFATHFKKSEFLTKFKKELDTLRPNEILLQQSLLSEIAGLDKLLNEHPSILKNYYPDWSFVSETAEKKLCNHFNVQNLKAFGLDSGEVEIPVAGLILDYLQETAGNLLSHIVSIKLYSDTDFLMLDEASRKNLELVTNLQDATSSYTLFEVLKQTKTALGTRLLQTDILRPLCKFDAIVSKQTKVDELYKNEKLLALVRKELSQVMDIQRLVSKIAMNKANGKDLLSLKQSLNQVLLLIKISEANDSFFLLLTSEERKTLEKIINLLESSINEECSTLLGDGKLIKKGWSKDLDALKDIHDNIHQILNEYLEAEQKRTGLQRLKISCNRMHGYFLEITKVNLTKTPKHFKLLKDLKKSKFFTTDELNAIEEKIENAEANISSLEKKLFDEITKKLLTVVQFLYKIADEVAELDEIQSFAQVAVMNFWVKPKITENGLLKILDGRHPIVEYHLPQGEFIPNDLTLCAQNPSLEKNTKNEHKTFALITGPNMAGKSTFLRQNALIVLLAQMGSFVPASSATIGICDKIFCRVGASDNLARGESTFLVEMSETAFILQNATEKSLVIMDEVGRGTSTEDGLAIAQAVSEYLLNTIKAKTIFATHYHELATLEHPALLHLKLEVANEADKIIFLKKVSEGVSENSYGIHVAKIAGIPQSAIDRAEKLLAIIAKERRDIDTSILQMPTESSETETKAPKLFSNDELILNEIASLDINNLRPIDALQLLEMWKRELESK
ncbi:MAG: DNA mismatch repair protein MutS [Treponemataceae bacterium]